MEIAACQAKVPPAVLNSSASECADNKKGGS
jgi:hypothetical protein